MNGIMSFQDLGNMEKIDLEKYRIYNKKWRDKNKEKISQIQKNYYMKNTEKVRTNNKRWKVNNPVKMRANHLKREYNISLEDYDKLLQKQESRCAICKIHKDELKNGKINLDVDHCHETGKVRGLLCPNCNKALGLFRDNPDIIKSTLEYLNKPI